MRCDPTLPFVVVRYIVVTGVYFSQDLYDQTLWPVCVACTPGLFEYLGRLMLICAQSGRVLGLEKKTNPASSARSDKKRLKDNNN